MKNHSGIALVCLHISAVLYALLFVIAVFLIFYIPNINENDPYAYYLALILMPVCLSLIIGVEWVARGLRQQKYWAWIIAFCIFILFLPSLLLPLGVFGLWGLLARDTRQAFGIGR